MGTARLRLVRRVRPSDGALVVLPAVCRQAVVPRVPERRLMTGTLVPVCDRYALPGSHYPCVPLAR